VPQLQLAALQIERKRAMSLSAHDANTAQLQTIFLCNALNIDRIKNIISDRNKLCELH